MVDAVITSRPSAGGGGGSFTADSPPTPADETAQLFGQVVTDTRPEVLYLFNGNVTNDGNLGAAGHGTATGITYAEALGATIDDFGDAAVFDSATDAIAVGGANAPFKLSANDGRGDFEFVFRFRFTAVDKLYALVSTDTTDSGATLNTTNGFYSVMVNTAGSGGSRIVFEYTLGGTLRELSWNAVTLAIDTDYHVVLSFKADADTFAGDATGTGVLRCFLDGVALADAAIGGNKFITAPVGIVDVGRKTGSTIWPLNLGLYLDGVAAAGVIEGAAYCHFDEDYVDAIRPSTPAVGTEDTGTGSLTFETSEVGGGFGDHLNIVNTSSGGGNYVTVPNPGWGTGAFTIEAFINPMSGAGTNHAWFGVNDVQNGSSGWTIGMQAYTGFTSLALYLETGGSGTLYFSSPREGVIVDEMAHYAIVREAENGSGTAPYRAYRNGIYMGAVSPTSGQTRDFTGEDLLIGRTYNGVYACLDINIDEFRFTHGEKYTGVSTDPASLNYVVPTAPSTAASASDRTFAGKMDEFAVYNSRCLHDTSDTFEKPVLPIRDTAVTIASGMDSEGEHGQIITTRNAGYVIPNSQQGLPGASLYNEDGFVKIRPA